MGVKRSVIFMLMGIGVLVVFVFAIAGMGTFQDRTTPDLSEPDRQFAEEEEGRHHAEIGIVPLLGSRQDAP